MNHSVEDFLRFAADEYKKVIQQKDKKIAEQEKNIGEKDAAIAE
jgi:hypothetical protein